MTLKPTARTRSLPKQDRAQQTYDLLLNVAAELLVEVGMDSISTNMISARAGLTPPALYRYFDDKYAILEALGRRLMEQQNGVFEEWLSHHANDGIDALRLAIEQLLTSIAAVTAEHPGAVWILRSLHASPRLSHIRVESHRHVTNRLTDVYSRHFPALDRQEIWQRLRLSVELAFAADGMLYEETRIAPEFAFRQLARMLQAQPFFERDHGLPPV